MPSYGATFEQTPVGTVENDFAYTNNMPITDATLRGTEMVDGESHPFGWFAGSEDDESKIVSVGGTNQVLQLNTDAATLTNKLASATKTAVNGALAAEGVAFFETEVKFVASDTPDANITGGTDATKFAIYAYCNEDNEPATTNLVVYHAYYDPENASLSENYGIGYTNEVFEGVTIDTEVYTKLRVEMKQIDVEGQPFNLFTVSVNGGAPLTSEVAYEGTTWFLTTERVGSDAASEVASLNFKGTGEIDNIKVGVIEMNTTYAIDWTGSDGVTVASAGNALVAGETNFVAGAEIVFTATGENVTITNIFVDGVAQSITNDTVYGYTVGAADAVVTVLAGVAVQPLDDTWTLTGFAPDAGNILPDAATSTDTTLVYSNFTGNYVLHNDSIGRTIDAFWIGAKIIAPEAVTSETIGNWKFDMAGQTGLSFNACKDGQDGETGLYYMYAWVPVTAAKVRAALAAEPKEDIVYTFDFYNENDLTVTQRLSMVVSPADVVLTNTDNVPGAEEIEVINWEETIVAEPTVITIALVNGATYTDAEGVLTFAAPQGYVVNSIYTNGVDTGSTTTFTTNGLTGTVNIVAAAKKVRPAVAHKWYENPGLVQAFNYPYYVDQQTGFHWDIDSTDAFLAAPSGFTGGGALLFSVDSLEATNSASIYQFAKNEAPLSLASIRGSAVAPQLNVMLIGSYNDTGLVSLPLSAEVFAWDENAFHIYTDNGVTPDSLHFSDDGRTLYATANAPNSARNYLFKYHVLDGLKSSGTNLVLEATWDIGSRTRALEIAKVGNTTFAYVHSGAGIKVIDVDNSSSVPVDAGASAEGVYDDMDVSGTHLYIYHGETGKLRIFDVAADGTLSLFKTFTHDELAAALGCTDIKIATSAGLAVTDDEKTIFFTNFDGGVYTASAMTFFVAQYVEPPTPTYDVDWTGSDGVTVTTNSIAVSGTSGTFEENTVIVFTPDQDTTITNILVDGVAQTGFDPASFSLTVVSDTNIVVLAGAAASADEFKAGDTYGDVTLTAAQAEWLNGFDNYAAIDTALKTDSSSLEKRYLLNVDPLTGDGALTLTAITVGADVRVTIALSRTEGETAVTGRAIKGTLKLYGASDLTVGFGSEPLGSTTIVDDDFSEGDTTTATFTGSGATFFKAVIE